MRYATVSQLMTPAANIKAVLDEIGKNFADDAAGNMLELIEHNEPGVALTILCSQIFEYGVEISPDNRFRLKNAALLMGLPLSDIDGMAG